MRALLGHDTSDGSRRVGHGAEDSVRIERTQRYSANPVPDRGQASDKRQSRIEVAQNGIQLAQLQLLDSIRNSFSMYRARSWIFNSRSLIRLITVGERIEVSLAAFPGELFSARVARIADTVNPETRTIQVIAELANPRGRLRPDMFGEIRHEETFRTIPAVPSAAIVQREGRTSVWREREPGHFESVDVTTGKARGGLVSILAGIQAGDRLVIDGAMLLESGN